MSEGLKHITKLMGLLIYNNLPFQIIKTNNVPSIAIPQRSSPICIIEVNAFSRELNEGLLDIFWKIDYPSFGIKKGDCTEDKTATEVYYDCINPICEFLSSSSTEEDKLFLSLLKF